MTAMTCENFTSLKVSYPPYKTAKIVNDMNRKYSRNLFRKPVFKKKMSRRILNIVLNKPRTYLGI